MSLSPGMMSSFPRYFLQMLNYRKIIIKVLVTFNSIGIPNTNSLLSMELKVSSVHNGQDVVQPVEA